MYHVACHLQAKEIQPLLVYQLGKFNLKYPCILYSIYLIGLIVFPPPLEIQVCIILGVMLMVIAPIGGLRQIIIQAKDYKFYS